MLLNYFKRREISKEIEEKGMWGLGTPEDLNNFLNNYSGLY